MLLFIVSRDSRSQFEYLKDAFAGEQSVQVILDRRVGQRRAHAGLGGAAERRRADRRARAYLDHELHTLGWALVQPGGGR